MKKPLAIGVDNYKEIINEEYYYVDKTLLMKELLDKKGKVSLFTRPRRFGKTLALSMLKTYFEKEYTRDGVLIDNSGYFEGMRILDAGERYADEMGQYPVISLSLKSAKQPDFETAYFCLKNEIGREFDRHNYIIESDTLTEEKTRFLQIRDQKAEYAINVTALQFLSFCLEKFHHKKAIILIDEYDVPLENAYFHNFYDQMIHFIRSLFESALKTNDSLQFAVITGCLRISKESIFTGLNNLEIISILNVDYAEYFGFTQSEINVILDDYELNEKEQEAKFWYDGYLFGKTEVYNPWSVINYVKSAMADFDAFPKPYWSNTSSNSIVRELIETANSEAKQEIENLISGGTIEKPVHEDITYGDIHKTQDNLWNFLFFTGYLKAESLRFIEDTIYLTMKIPNMEVRYIYRKFIREWFDEKIKVRDFSSLYQAFADIDEAKIETEIRDILKISISYYDGNESFYHGIMTGLLQGWSNYTIKSNRESGDGRPDLVLIPLDERDPLYILEFKYTKVFTEMDAGCQKALQQIEDQNYAEEFLNEGYLNIRKLGICFCKKSCRVKSCHI
ncbi:AAA family ATPase [Hespellia stercorisuis]|uniref:PD-(D/E)XK nuclease superfamily protein n=1 Tax=Hespellia stercorisuis DSM 15480 TaxID=1121950 RepID=A0A1M6S6X0_9FIRM|nr:AAA family ATPase [Hespellia stercorisuis]SHK40522.1 PD-(D/E)XK nuclease superfamily protein [Hespellia stercorisuis DSM 15480]